LKFGLGDVMNLNTCKKYEPYLAAKVFGDLSAVDEQKLQMHLADCVKCRGALAEMQRMLGALGEARPPVMPEHFWEGYWYRLVERMEKGEQAAPKRIPVSERVREWLRATWIAQPLVMPLARTAGILALLIFGVLIGHYWWPHESERITGTTPAPMTAVPTRASQWLERSKILLIGVMNEDFSAVDQPDFSQQRQISQNLVTEARAIRQEINPADNRQLLQLMSQLELILLQIAHLEAERDLAAVELVREGIARDGLLLKINITEMAQQGQRSTPLAKPDRESF
jgi:hypothetical protein